MNDPTPVLNGEITNDSPRFAPGPMLGRGVAADGSPIPTAAFTGGQFIDQLEAGQFSQDLHRALGDLAADMTDMHAIGQKTKGKITITIDLTKEDDAFRIASKFDVKAPKMPRPKTIMWSDEHNRFTRFPPGQNQLFGDRNVPSVRTE